MGLKVFLREGREVFLGGDGLLTGEDGAAILFGGLWGDLVLDIAGDDRGVLAPDVHLEGEVAADEGNLVLVDGRVDNGEGVGAGRAFEIFELVDGDRDTRGGAEHGGVAIGPRLSKSAEGKGEEQSGGEDNAVH